MPKAKELKEKEPVELQNKRRQEESQSPLQDSRPKLEEVREWFRIEDGKTVFLEKVYAELTTIQWCCVWSCRRGRTEKRSDGGYRGNACEA